MHDVSNIGKHSHGKDVQTVQDPARLGPFLVFTTELPAYNVRDSRFGAMGGLGM